MATLEELFFREFNQMMNQRRAQNPTFDIYQLDLPPQVLGDVCTKEMVYIKDIGEEYYKELNDTEAILWSHGKLSRRKYDYQGKYIMKDGHYLIEDVNLPHEAVAVVSDKNINLPAKFKPANKEPFEFVDCIFKTNEDGSKIVKRVYIIPRKYCFKLRQTALVLSLNKLRSYYAGGSISLQNGYTVFMYVIPYRPRATTPRTHRVLKTKTNLDYRGELNMIFQYWASRGYTFNTEMCELYEFVKGKRNLAYEDLPPTVDTYIRFDPDKSMGKEDSVADMWGAELDEYFTGDKNTDKK